MKNKRQFATGFTMVELMITMVISSILAMAIGTLLIGGQRSWEKTYRQANSKIKGDAQAIMAAFGSVGRKSNRLGYTLYHDNGSSYVKAVPQTSQTEEVVFGDAVEFRYWSASVPGSGLLDVTNTGTDYAFFYIDGDSLKVDYGTNPPGAVPGGSGVRNSSNTTTMVLSESVIPDPNGAFNHTTINTVGQGSVRINITLEDEDDPTKTIQVLTSTLLRNIWPR